MLLQLSQINPIVGDIRGNSAKIIKAIEDGKKNGVDLILFPEMALSGYPPEDFLLLPHYIDDLAKALNEIIPATKGIAVIVGTVRKNPSHSEKPLFNTAAVIENGVLLGFQDKMLLPTYGVFDERRFFEPSKEIRLWNICQRKIAITICEDIWQHAALVKETTYERDPVIELSKLHPDLCLNLSSSPFSMNKQDMRYLVCAKAAKTLKCPLAYCNQVGGNDSLIFDGRSLYYDAKGRFVSAAKAFQEDQLIIDTEKSIPQTEIKTDAIGDLYHALVLGLKDYFHKQGFKKACLGISGGIDSGVVACLAKEALGKENVFGLMMPSRYSTPHSLTDAAKLIDNLGIASQVISIEDPFQSYLSLLKPHFDQYAPDTTEENLQARIRGMILMAFSNKMGYIVLSTGNKSELAMGYATLYGDMCGGLCVLSDVTKQQVYQLANFINRDHEVIPKHMITKAPSAELAFGQKDSDSLPEYPIIDNVLQAYIAEHQTPEVIAKTFGYPLSLVKDLIIRIHRNEYKRRQSAPGLCVSERSFTVGRHFPIVQKYI